MSDAFPGALTGYGWSERVATLFSSERSPGAARPGRVIRVERGAVIAIDATGGECPCPPIGGEAAGDWVVIDGPRLARILPRWSSLNRQDPDNGGVQVLAANVDVVLVTIPGDRPNIARAERELVVAWESGGRPVIVLTKADLSPAGLLDELTGRMIGVDVVATSVETGVGVSDLAGVLAPDRTGVMLGPSGAGKSSLTNALLGEQRQAIGAVRADDRRGRHTTSRRDLVSLPGGGVVIDTPGLRSLGLIAAERIDQAFPDIEELAAGCRFSDCAHGREPGCAVTAAAASGVLSRPRLASYQKLVREADADRKRHDPIESREAKRIWKQRSIDARRYDKRRGAR